jgi:hypothetical protein
VDAGTGGTRRVDLNDRLARAQLDIRFAHAGLVQDREQVAAVDHHVGAAVELVEVAQVE